MADWNYWLGRKYSNMEQDTAARTTAANAGLISANAGANLDTVRAGLLPGQAASDIAEANSRANLNTVQAQLAPGAAAANEAAQYGSAFANRQQGRLYGVNAAGEEQDQELKPSLGLLGNAILQHLSQQLGMPSSL